jgi:hypothetical protein
MRPASARFAKDNQDGDERKRRPHDMPTLIKYPCPICGAENEDPVKTAEHLMTRHLWEYRSASEWLRGAFDIGE